MIYFCCDRSPAQRPRRQRRSTASIIWKCSTTRSSQRSGQSAAKARRPFHQRPGARRARHARIFTSKAASAFATSSRSTPPSTDDDAEAAERRARPVRRFFDLYAAAGAEPQNADAAGRIDPLFAAVDFSFKVDCPTRFRLPAAMRLSARARPKSRRSTILPRTTRASAG